MKRTTSAFISVVLCVCCTSPSTWAMVRAEGELYAGCMVKITVDPAVYPLTVDNVAFLIRRTGVGQSALDATLAPSLSADDAIIVEALEPAANAGETFGGAAAGPMVGMYVGGGGGMGMMGGMGGFGGISGTVPDPYAAEPKDAANPPTGGTRNGARYDAGGYGIGGTAGMGGYGDGAYVGYAGPSRYAVQSTALGESASVTMFVHVAVDLRQSPDTVGTAKSALEAVIANLRAALENGSNQHMKAVGKQATLMDEEASRAEKELSVLQSRLRELSGARDLSRQGIQQSLRELRSYLDSSMRERAANRATAEAMAKQLAETKAQLEKQIAGDMILGELTRMFEIAYENEEQVRKLAQAGTVSVSEISQAAERTLRARIELAKRKEELGTGAQAAGLNMELANLSVKVAQLDAEIAHLEQQVGEARELLEKADAYERESLKLGLARRNLEEAITLRDRAGRRIRTIVPAAVIVIGAE